MCRDQEDGHLLGWHAVHEICTSLHLKNPKLIVATNNRHRISMYFVAVSVICLENIICLIYWSSDFKFRIVRFSLMLCVSQKIYIHHQFVLFLVFKISTWDTETTMSPATDVIIYIITC